jgi:transcription initiation factor TFIID subunit 2
LEAIDSAAKQQASAAEPKDVAPSPVVPPAAPSTSTRIKLKVPQNDSRGTPKPVASKARSRRPKPIDVPPPPYVDDGSHDLLQEVIAIEKEKSAHRSRSGAEKDLPLNAKRKLLDDDEIIALASPAKKEKPSPTSPTVSTTKEVRSPSVAISVPEPPKSKKEKSAQASSSRQPSETPRISLSLKGKAKEVVAPPPPVPSPSKPKKSAPGQATPLNEKKCKDILKALLKLPEAAIFARPVDPELDGCPT